LPSILVHSIVGGIAIHFFFTHVILIQKVSIFVGFCEYDCEMLGLRDEYISYIHEFIWHPKDKFFGRSCLSLPSLVESCMHVHFFPLFCVFFN